MSTTRQQTTSRCVVCEVTKLVQETTTFIPASPDIPIGPASRDYRQTRVKFYCPTCGLAYHHLPKSATVRKAAIRKQ